jgi:ring-1,2-phenylacetyl-CoA epoxidase subunit PaaE
MHMSGTCVAFAADAGIASAVGIVKRLLSEDRANRVLVFCGTQSEEHAEPLEELLALKDRHLDRLSLSFVMNREPDEAELLSGRLDAAKVSALASKLFDAKSVREYHVCGPRQLIDDVSEALKKSGVDAPRIRQVEVGATASGIGTPRDGSAAGSGGATRGVGASAVPGGAGQGEATNEAATPAAAETRVEFVMDGRRRSFPMQTGTESILDAAARAGIDLPFSCKAGVCSTCRTKLVRGQVEMVQNYALEDWELEAGFILACQSHAKTPEIELTYDEK